MAKVPRQPHKRPARPVGELFIGGWIRALGLQPRDVARQAPMNEGYLSQLINGRKKRPTFELLTVVAKAINFLIPGLNFTPDLFRQPPPQCGSSGTNGKFAPIGSRYPVETKALIKFFAPSKVFC